MWKIKFSTLGHGSPGLISKERSLYLEEMSTHIESMLPTEDSLTNND